MRGGEARERRRRRKKPPPSKFIPKCVTATLYFSKVHPEDQQSKRKVQCVPFIKKKSHPTSSATTLLN
jgi:hypothetical protein